MIELTGRPEWVDPAELHVAPSRGINSTSNNVDWAHDFASPQDGVFLCGQNASFWKHFWHLNRSTLTQKKREAKIFRHNQQQHSIPSKEKKVLSNYIKHSQESTQGEVHITRKWFISCSGDNENLFLRFSERSFPPKVFHAWWVIKSERRRRRYFQPLDMPAPHKFGFHVTAPRKNCPE